jgi:hypothetical protein
MTHASDLYAQFPLTPMQLAHWAKMGYLTEDGSRLRAPGPGRTYVLTDRQREHLGVMATMVTDLQVQPKMASKLAWRLLDEQTIYYGDFEIRRITDGGVQLQ